ncbi:MAG: IS3 family transposase [Deltaproteobacteria bacterium]|nr:IS3 family transposase [Deltaproteobacteria bacterium]
MSERTGIAERKLVAFMGLGASKNFDWKQRYGLANEHNAKTPRDHWLTEDETKAIVAYAEAHPLEGYRRLTYMMMDANIVAVSPTTTYRVMKQAGLLRRWNGTPSRKGTGFVQPLKPHEHWHVDIAYRNLGGTFFYLMTVLDGASRAVLHWEIRESMRTSDVELVLQVARELYPNARPRIISDNGPQFIAKDFKEFVRLSGMTHVRTSPYYLQSNGKLERFHKTIKSEGIRPMTPLTLEDARKVVGEFIRRYNEERLHSGIGYVTPKTRIEGRHEAVFVERDRKLDEAGQRRAGLRAMARRAATELQSVA